MLELLEQIIAQSGLLIHEAFERGLSSCFDDSKVEGSVLPLSGAANSED